MRKTFYLLIFIFAFASQIKAQFTQLDNFDNTSDLTNLFNPPLTTSPYAGPLFSPLSSGGINNTACINVPLGSDQIWTTKAGYSITNTGVYTLSAYFYVSQNSGYGGLGFSTADQNSVDSYGAPENGIGMVFHGGGGYFANNRSLNAVAWDGGDLILNHWYYFYLQVTALGSDLYNIDFKIYPSDANGNIGTMKTEKTETNVLNTAIGSACALHVYFAAAQNRMTAIDNFNISLSGGAINLIAPSIATNTVSSISQYAATCGGNTINDNGFSVTDKGVCWSTTSGDENVYGSKLSNGTGTADFTSSISGLSPSTTYYLKAYATNCAGTNYGNEVSFTTPAPIITTSKVIKITQNIRII